MAKNQNSEKLENVAMVTLKPGIADFGAQFHPNDLDFGTKCILIKMQ